MVITRFERTQSAVKRILFAGLGSILLGVGIAGYIIPGLPGTVFLLMALWFFGRSNEKMFRWMLSNRFFGRQLVDYKAGLGIPLVIKFIAIGCIVLFSGLSLFQLNVWWQRAGLGLVALYGIAFIATRPTREKVLARAHP